jgi:hypothetical protein
MKQGAARAAGSGATSSQPFAHGAPVLFRLPFHSRRGRILDLDPVVRSAEPIRRAEPLRYDAFASELTGMMEDDRAFDAPPPVRRKTLSLRRMRSKDGMG